LAFEGEVKYHGIVSHDDAAEFMKGVKEHIEKCGNNYAEVQYKPVIQRDGSLLYTAYVVGRAREEVSE
jgi:hypothetical protein